MVDAAVCGMTFMGIRMRMRNLSCGHWQGRCCEFTDETWVHDI